MDNKFYEAVCLVPFFWFVPILRGLDLSSILSRFCKRCFLFPGNRRLAFGQRPRVSVSLPGFFACLFVHFGVSVAHFGGRRGENRGSEGDYVIRDMISTLLLGWIHTAMVYF